MTNYSEKDCQKFIDQYKALLNTSMTLKDVYENFTACHADKKCCIYFDEDDKKRTYTYSKYKDNVWFLAKRLSSLFSAIPAGSVVGLKLKNSPIWPLMFWAILMTGHPVLLIAANLQHDNTENLLKDAKAKAIIANEEDAYSIPSFRVNNVRNADEDAFFAANWANEIIFCSSGTTGNIKMMVMNGENICYQIASVANVPSNGNALMNPGEIRILAMIPFHHIFGFVAVFLLFSFYGKTLVYPNSSSSTDLLNAIRKGSCTHVFSVPIFWDGIAQQLERTTAQQHLSTQELIKKMLAYNNHQISKEEAGFSSSKLFLRIMQKKVLGKQVQFCISGGGYLLPKTCSIINGLSYPLNNGYGMTEIGVTSVEQSSKVEKRLLGSIGKPLAGVEYKIIPLDSEHPFEGELCVKSKITHVEEIINGVRSKTTLDNGYYHTGDIAFKDNSGSYYIKGRIKDTIIASNGENVYPDEIESYFRDIKHIRNLVVFGQHENNTEKIILVVDLENSVSTDELPKIKDDIDSINITLPNEKRISCAYIYKKALPMANNMKVKRFVLQKELESKPENFLSFNGEVLGKKPISFEGYDSKDVTRVINKVRKVFSKTLYLPEYKIENNASWADDLGGDSMSYVTMVQELNSVFKISIPTEKYGKLLTIAEFTKEILDNEKKIEESKKNNEK